MVGFPGDGNYICGWNNSQDTDGFGFLSFEVFVFHLLPGTSNATKRE
jgi:hypothetical protein